MSDVTRVLSRIDSGHTTAAEQLLPLALYDELRRLAADKLAHEKAGQTLHARALVVSEFRRGRFKRLRDLPGHSGIPPC